jgi:CheY-like chemotaxis protein
MSPRTVLLVDDDEDILTLYRLALRHKSDWNIYSAIDGPTALARSIDIQPNLIVMDVMLPGGMTGIEVCRQLRSHFAAAQVPVVMVSALSDPHTSQAARSAGAQEFWTKPVSPIKFVKHLEKLMGEMNCEPASTVGVGQNPLAM